MKRDLLTVAVSFAFRERRIRAGTLEFGDLLLDLGELRRIEPDVGPVALSNRFARAGSNRLEHVLGRVGGGRAVSTVLGEVSTEDMRVFSDVSKVDLRVQEVSKVYSRSGRERHIN